MDPSPALIDILRSVLRRLDEDSPGGLSDPAVLRFKRHILRSIAQLELQRRSLKAPDVLSPSTSSQTSAGPPDQSPPPHTPDSVVVLVARGKRKRRDDGGGNSSAA